MTRLVAASMSGEPDEPPSVTPSPQVTSKCVVSDGWISPGGNLAAVKLVLMLPLRAALLGSG